MAAGEVIKQLVARIGFDFDDKGYREAQKGFGSLQAAAQGLVGYFVGSKLLQGMKSLTLEIADQADAANDAATSYGLTVQAFQELTEGAAMAGVSADELGMGLARISKLANDAAGGSKEAKKTFSELGISYKDASGNLRTSDDLFGQVADAIQKTEAPAKRTAIAMDFFGRSGAKMIPILKDGAAGVAAMREDVRGLGGVFDQKLVNDSAEFNDNLDRLKLVALGARAEIAKELIPSLNGIVVAFLNWRKTRPADFALWMDRIKLALQLAAVAAGIFAGVMGLKLLGALGGAAAQIPKLIAGMRALTLSELAAMAGPVLLGLAVLGLIVILEDLWVSVHGGDSAFGRLKDWFNETVENGDGVVATIARIVAVVGGPLQAAADLLGGTLYSLLKFLKDVFTDGVDAAFSNLRQNMDATVENAKDHLSFGANAIGKRGPGSGSKPVDIPAGYEARPVTDSIGRTYYTLTPKEGVGVTKNGAGFGDGSMLSPTIGASSAGGTSSITVTNNIQVTTDANPDEIASKAAAQTEAAIARQSANIRAAHVPAPSR